MGRLSSKEIKDNYMTQTLQKYLETGEPILVLTENGLLVLYELEKRDLSGASSGIGHQTQGLFRSCLARIEGEPFNPNDFIKISKDRIFHLGLTQSISELKTLPRIQRYLFHRMGLELACEISGEEFPLKPLKDLEEWEFQKEFERLPPEKKTDWAFQTLKDIRMAAQSDVIGERQRMPGKDFNTPALYEVRFDRGVYPGLDIYIKK